MLQVFSFLNNEIFLKEFGEIIENRFVSKDLIPTLLYRFKHLIARKTVPNGNIQSDACFMILSNATKHMC